MSIQPPTPTSDDDEVQHLQRLHKRLHDMMHDIESKASSGYAARQILASLAHDLEEAKRVATAACKGRTLAFRAERAPTASQPQPQQRMGLRPSAPTGTGVPCRQCGHPSTRCRLRVSSGWHVGDWCFDCDVTANARQPFLPKAAAGDPLGYPERYVLQPEVSLPCEVCGEATTELHHWAPRALFDLEAYAWPTAWLCHDCHTRWHATVWPGPRETK